MLKLRVFAFSALLLTMTSCNAIMSNMDMFKGLAGKVASSVTGLGSAASSIGLGGTTLASAKSMIEKATGTLGGLQGQMADLAAPDEAIKKMLSDKLSGPIRSTTDSLNGAAAREPGVAESASGAVDVLKKISGMFGM